MAETVKLIDILSKDEKEEKKAELEVAVQRASLQVMTDELSAKSRLADAKNRYNKALNSLPFNPAAVINAKRDVADAEQDIKDLAELKSLF